MSRSFLQRALANDLKDRLPANSPAGHYVWSIGSVDGGNETQRGAGVPVQLRSGIQNPLLMDDEVIHRRSDVNMHLEKEFAKLPAPRSLRAVFLDCEKCGEIHSDLNRCQPKLDEYRDRSGGDLNRPSNPEPVRSFETKSPEEVGFNHLQKTCVCSGVA
jgi:hypothetical protein